MQTAEVLRAPDGRAEVIAIRLDEPEAECIACGAMTPRRWGLPMYEGEFIENDDPGEWAGFDACRECFEAHRIGGLAGLQVRLRALREGKEG